MKNKSLSWGTIYLSYPPHVPLPWLVSLAGLLCIPVASVALAPLSLAAARHR